MGGGVGEEILGSGSYQDPSRQKFRRQLRGCSYHRISQNVKGRICVIHRNSLFSKSEFECKVTLSAQRIWNLF